MRKHVLSRYVEKQAMKNIGGEWLSCSPTIVIETPSDSDPDEFFTGIMEHNAKKIANQTINRSTTDLTEQVESSDPDEFYSEKIDYTYGSCETWLFL